MKSNLTVGHPMAKAKNSPGPLAKSKRSNISQTTPTSKPKNRPAPYAKNREATTYRPGPSSTAPKNSNDDARIRSELMAGKRNNSHSRGGR